MEAIIWLVVMVVAFIVESMTLSLVSVWFAGGAAAALFTGLLGFSAPVQITIFALVSALLLPLMRPIAKNALMGRKVRTNADRVIGNVGVVIQQIDPLKNEGQVKVIGQVWSAKPEDGMSVIARDRQVVVTAIAGVKVVVREIM